MRLAAVMRKQEKLAEAIGCSCCSLRTDRLPAAKLQSVVTITFPNKSHKVDRLTTLLISY